MDDSLATETSVQLCNLLDQSLEKIRHCLAQIDESELWWRPNPETISPAPMNSIGNLLLHIAGNLQQWTVVPIHGTQDDRNREHEFSLLSSNSRPKKQQLISKTEKTVCEAKNAIHSSTSTQFLQSMTIQGFNVNLLQALLHTCCHFQGHTQQIILLTRLIKKSDYKFHWSPDMGRKNLPM